MSETQAAGVIHDLGYRQYEAPGWAARRSSAP